MAQFGAFQTHSQGAELVPSVAGLAIASFIRLLAVRYLHLRSEHANKESTFVWGDISWRGVQGVQARSCWAERECLISARFYFGVGPLQEQISECVVLWRTSKWLRWNSLIVIESWTPPFLTWSLSASSAWSTQLFIKDGYRRVWGESRGFSGANHLAASKDRLSSTFLCVFFTIKSTSNGAGNPFSLSHVRERENEWVRRTKYKKSPNVP